MRSGVRTISNVQIDDYIPQSVVCIRCHLEIADHSAAHYGRIVGSWQSSQERSSESKLVGGRVITFDTITEYAFPRKITGLCCTACFESLYNTTWRDKNGHLRRAFEIVHAKVDQPINDDHDASKITKGLYAPHAGGKRGNHLSDCVIKDEQIAEYVKLQGFERPEPRDHKLKPKRIVVRNGKWKENPDEYIKEPNRHLLKPSRE